MNDKISYENACPNPEYLIKSISEQGYSLETSLADLIDNSISAKASEIEILIDTDKEPFTLFIADNGLGMDDEVLKLSMQLPCNSPEDKRDINDLGRFGLGMKTASFSQTRRFTVLSRKQGERKYYGRTWDVNYLKEVGEWRIIINSDEEILNLIKKHELLSDNFLNKFDKFSANTIIVLCGLYKFEKYLQSKNRQKSLKKEITEVTSDHLSLVFHRYMEKKNPVRIRINNQRLSPFNPFPTKISDFRSIEYRQKNFGTDKIKIEGFVLPSRSIDESKRSLSVWTTKYKSLMDMEGIYIYRLDRIILFGKWNGLAKKASKLQLARLRVEIGNSVDHLLHLNVAKSKVVIPHDLKQAFENYIEELKTEAEKEYFNRGIKRFSDNKRKNNIKLFERRPSSKGVLLELNTDFPLLKALKNNLTKKQVAHLNLLIRMINTTINRIRHTHEELTFIGVKEKDGVSKEDLISCIAELKNCGLDSKIIKNKILPDLGYTLNSLPEEVGKLLE